MLAGMSNFVISTFVLSRLVLELRSRVSSLSASATRSTVPSDNMAAREVGVLSGWLGFMLQE